MPQVPKLWQWWHHQHSLVCAHWSGKVWSCASQLWNKSSGVRGLRLVLTCDSVHLWRLYSAALLEHQATSTMTCYLTQSHYPDTELTSPCPILIIQSIRLGSDKYQFLKSFGLTRPGFQNCKVWIRTHDLQILQSYRTGSGRSTHSVTSTG